MSKSLGAFWVKEMDKTAQDDFLGRVMAHAFQQEMRLIKESSTKEKTAVSGEWLAKLVRNSKASPRKLKKMYDRIYKGHVNLIDSSPAYSGPKPRPWKHGGEFAASTAKKEGDVLEALVDKMKQNPYKPNLMQRIGDRINR
jgi:hypothetical protein